MAGGQGSEDFGNIKNVVLAFGVLAIIILLNKFTTGFIKTISILIGIIIGTLIAAMMGMVDFAKVGEADWIHGITPFYFGMPTFDLTSIITMTLVAIVSLIESTGVYLALGDITNKKVSEKDLANGYRAEGIASVIGGIFNSFPYTAYSQNVGLVQLTGVKTKNVIYAAGTILVILGFIPKIAAITTLIPTAVLGGASLAMFGMVVSYGIKMLGQVDFNHQGNLLILACSIGMGLGVTVVPDIFMKFPESIRILFQSGIVAGGLTAIILNILFNIIPGSRAKTVQMEEKTAA